MKTRLCFSVFSMGLLLSNPTIFAQTSIEVSDTITENTTWSADTVKVNGDITVPYGLTLTIDTGVQVIFQGYYSINVQGRILAVGNDSSGILFTINDTTGAANRSTTDGIWAGIKFTGWIPCEADTSKFIYCTMSYASNAIYIVQTHNVEVINSTMINNYGDNGAAIYIHNYNQNSYVLVKECLITKNVSSIGGAIYCYCGVKINILNNEFSYNKATFMASVIYYGSQGGIIRGNIIKFNTTEFNGTIYCSGKNIEISRNIIHDNTGKSTGGICFSSTHNSLCKNNTIINNSASWGGGGIDCSESNFEISNNVICNNSCSNGAGGINISNSNIVLTGNTICNNEGSDGGGLVCTQSETRVYNTILWGNTSTKGNQIYIEDNFSSPDIYYSDIESGTGGFGYSPGTSFNGEYLNNIQLNPQFISPAVVTGVDVNAMSADWSIQDSSPCINAGTPDLSDLEIPDYDCNDNPRVGNGRIDIGAYEAHIDKIFASDTISSNTEWIADTVEVTGDIYVPDNVTLRIPPGTYISFTGHFKINVHGTLLANGTREENIIFEVKDTTGFSQTDTITGSWDGIDFNNGLTWTGGANGMMNDNDSSVLTYCILQHAKSNYYGGAIFIDHFSLIRIENCVIQHCGTFGYEIHGGGLYCVYGNPVLRNTKIENNFSQFRGSGIFMENSDMLIENCTINNNRSDHVGAGIYMYNAEPVINNTLISNNSSKTKGGYGGGDFGGGIFCQKSNPVFANCKILNNQHNSHGAAALLWEGNPVFINCLFANNDGISWSGIIYLNFSDGAIFINNTIVSNSATALMVNASVVKIYNTIIWGNNEQFQISGPIQTKIDIYNSIIQNGIPDSYIADGLVRNYINVSELNPQFINPSGIIGYDEEAIFKDYTVSSFSPSINKGTTNIQNHIIGGKDLNGNPRIIADSVDIGAFEHQGSKITILDQPIGVTICEGKTMSLSVTVNDTAHVQWQKDGSDIPGANAYTYIVAYVSSNNQGNYKCLASNAYGITTSQQTTVFVTQLPRVQITASDPWVVPGKESVIQTYASGTNIKYQWKKDGNILPGEDLPEYHFIPDDFTYEGNYTCEVFNTCSSIESNPVYILLAPQICMVTVSTITGNNLVIWEKNSKAQLTDFNIYRESTAAGIYDLIGTVPYNNLSVFEDTIADPAKQAYIYKITGIDISGTETDIDLCMPHKTIHLIVSTNPELKSTQLQWDKYYGFDYQTYNIYRSNTGTNFTVIDAMSSTLNSWTDPESLTGELYYRVAVEKPVPCVPTGGSKKAESGPYSHSMSNMDDNRLQAGEYPPDTLMLTNNYIDENNFVGKLIGRFLTTDPDTNDAFTYTLVNGDGDDDNLSFTVLADLLIAADYFDYEIKNQYSIRIRSTDKTGNIIESSFIININDLSEPTGMNSPSGQQVMIYPNPFRQTSTIIFPNPEGNEYTLLIMNLSGKVVRRVENITTSSFLIEQENLESGYYLIELRGEKVFRGRIVVE